MTAKGELEHKIATCNEHIRLFTEKVAVLSSSLQAKKAQLQSMFESCHKTTMDAKQMSDFMTLSIEIAELKQSVWEAEFQKQQYISKKETAVQAVEANQEDEMQVFKNHGKACKLHALPYRSYKLVTSVNMVVTGK